MRLRPSSLRARLTLWYTILLGVPLIVFAVACYAVVARALEHRTDQFIGDALTAFSRELVAERRGALTAEQAMRSTINEVHFRDLRIAILDSSGGVAVMSGIAEREGEEARVAASSAESRLVDALRNRDAATPSTLEVSSAEGDFRVLSRPIEFDGARYVLAGAYSMRDIESVLSRIRQMFLLAIPLLLLSAAIGGSMLARRSLSPVASMAREAASITARNIHQRLPVEGGDELVGLARVVNGLLDRLEHSFEQQRRFVADASHELRTPTAIVRTEADVTLSRPHRTEEEYRTSIAVIQNAARRATRIVDDLFLLARADAGHLAMRNDPLYLEEIVHDATQAIRSVAGQRGVNVTLGNMFEAPVHGDADLLGRLLLNLLDNAVKYSASGGEVTVQMRRMHGDDVSGNAENSVAVSIVDNGPGIPADLQQRVFERFFRVDRSRAQADDASIGGAGLGLSIAQRIAELHGGRITIIESRPGRTEIMFSMRAGDLPASQRQYLTTTPA